MAYRNIHDKKRNMNNKKSGIINVILENKLMLYCFILVILVVVLIPALINADKIKYEEDNQPVVGATTLNAENSKEKTTEKQTQEATTTVDNKLYEVSIVAVGDDLISDSVTHCGLQSDGSYDFSELFEELKPEFTKADLAVINQETILGGPDFEYTGYPCFNSPFEIGDAIIDAGFDVVLQATNHSFDKGVKGIENCRKYWSKHPEVTMVGLNKSEKQQNKITVVEKNNIKFAILNYTYGLNGFRLPAGQEYLVDLIDEEKIVKDLKKAEEIADFTIVFPHWGVEYTHEPTNEQRQLADLMVENGADLIIGTHPHVVESIEWIEADNGNKALCYFSLGNYTSSQDQTKTMLGGIAKLTVAKQAGNVYIEEGAGIIPIVTHYIWGSGRLTKTYRLTDYTEELARVHSINSVTNDFSLSKLQEISDEVLGDWVIE